MSFAFPQMMALMLALVPILWFATRRRKALGHSQVSMHSNLRRIPLIGWIPNLLLVLFWTALCLALSRPLLQEITEKEAVQTRDFVITTDISGSMSATISDPGQQAFGGADSGDTQNNQPPKRIQVAEKAIAQFVERRQGDRVALLLFDDDCYYSWPLSTDLNVIRQKNNGVSKYNGGGTNFEGPTSANDTRMGAIQGSINHFKELGQAKSKVLILVTDGEASISDQRFAELSEQLSDLNIKIYVLGVGEGWVNNSSMTQPLRRLTETAGGQVIVVGDAQQMRDGFNTIDALEKSRIEVEKNVSYREIYHLFVMASVGLGFLFLIASALVREDA